MKSQPSQVLSPLAAIHKDFSEQLFTKLIRLPFLAEARRPRVATMMGLRRLVMHINDPKLLNLETSNLGQWCLQSLYSSVRELRIASGRALAAFSLSRDEPSLAQVTIRGLPTRQQHPQDKRAAHEMEISRVDGLHSSTATDETSEMKRHNLIHRNRKVSIAFLKSISDKSQPSLTETFIMAWGQLGRVVSEDELNLVLIKLLEYLGSSNNIVSAFAFNELLSLSEARGTTPRRLFEPFWPNLAYMATKDMVQRPQMSRAIAELLQVSVNELLELIQTYALPWLVLDRQKDVIQKITEARHETDIWLPLMDASNLAATVALLLMQDTDDIVGFAKSRLDSIHPHFHPLSLLELLQSEPVLIAMELLKAAGEADETRKPIVRPLDLRTIHTAHSCTRRFAEPWILWPR